MVDTALAAFRLLELIALLFPVVALLVQLQHRAADSVELKVLGLVTGTSLLVLLSISFLHLSLYLVSTYSLPALLIVPLVGMSVLSFALPVLIVLSSESITNRTKRVLIEILTETFPVWCWNRPDSGTNRSEEAGSDERRD
jgi:hypothetical protein